MQVSVTQHHFSSDKRKGALAMKLPLTEDTVPAIFSSYHLGDLYQISDPTGGNSHVA